MTNPVMAAPGCSKEWCAGDDAFAHRPPVVGDLLQADGLADVHEVEDVFLEAGASEAHRCIEELGADAGVGSNRIRHLHDWLHSIFLSVL